MYFPRIWLNLAGITYRIETYNLETNTVIVICPFGGEYHLNPDAVAKAPRYVLSSSMRTTPEMNSDNDLDLEDADDDLDLESVDVDVDVDESKWQKKPKEKKSSRIKTSKYIGVCWHKAVGKWHTQIRHNKALFRLGYFEIEEAAARAYDRKVLELRGNRAKLNFPIKK